MGKRHKQVFSRRAFFIHSAAAGAGAIASTGSGILAAEKYPAEAEASAQTMYSWETPPPPIPDNRLSGGQERPGYPGYRMVETKGIDRLGMFLRQICPAVDRRALIYQGHLSGVKNENQ